GALPWARRCRQAPDQRAQIAAGCSGAAGGAEAAAAASSRTAEDAAMLAIVKSRSVIVALEPAGSVTLLIWMLSPMSSPVRLAINRSGISSTAHLSSTP